jgi:hypothetical protein
LFSYCIPIDDGAAPNPFWGVCTLAICKPKIRKAAKVGDWVLGTGSKNSPIGNILTKVVYAMKVTRRVTMRDYDRIARIELPKKLPDWENTDARRRLGDSIYDFSTRPAAVRRSVHDERNRKRDLSGEYVLLSTEFWYFGDKPIELRTDLHQVIKAGQGHRRIEDPATVTAFVEWIKGLGFQAGTLQGDPQWRDLEARCVLDLEED